MQSDACQNGNPQFLSVSKFGHGTSRQIWQGVSDRFSQICHAVADECHAFAKAFS